MRKASLILNLLLFIGSITAELLGYGFIARYRAGELYDFILRTHAVAPMLAVYVVMFIIGPAINLVALISKDRGILIER